MPNKKLICRLCWNEDDWKHPSKKPKNIEKSDSYVSTHSYGHEEWLFRLEWLIDGKHYAFLQGIGKNKYVGGTYDITLYIYNKTDKEHWI
ncbi:MAG: hypothetical protein LBV04_08875, partial [Deferribacteraceae bacterium]|nr:hypothetical protein [Deferribacteraceae bacterium]